MMQQPTTFFSLIRLMICGLLGNLLAYSVVTAQIITTIAGPNNVGDGGQAVLATLDEPTATCVDPAGNMYIAEGSSHRIRKVSPAGVITTIAGTGVFGFSGDGGPATAANLYYPTSIAIDGTGNLYVADYYNNRIRKISKSSIITTVAGTGSYGFSGDGGPATAATFNGAFGVATDASGNLYIADVGNDRIRKVSATGIITTIAGTNTFGFSGDGGPATAAQLNAPTVVTTDAAGNIYIGDFQNARIRKINTSGIISTIAGTGAQGTSGDGGSALTAQISFQLGLTVDAPGNIYFSDLFNNRVRKISTSGIITRIAGTTAGAGYNGDNRPATDATLSSPAGIVLDAGGNLLIADQRNNRIRRVSTAGSITTVAGPNNAGFAGDGGSALLARLNTPSDVKADANGNIYIADFANLRIRKISPAGIITTIAGTGVFGFSGDNGPATSANLTAPYGLLPDANGDIYIADTFNNRIRKINANGIITTVAGTGSNGFSGDGGPAISAQLSFPYNIALDAAGNLYIADANNYRIRKVSTNGVITTVVGTGVAGFSGDGGAATAARIDYPTGIAIDAANNLYIADNRNHRIRKVTAAGIISTIAGTGVAGFDYQGVGTAVKLNYPFGIVVDPAGTVFFCDNGNSCIRKLLPDGTISTVSGALSFYLGRGFSGDNDRTDGARFSGAFSLGLDASGNLLIADSGNSRIRRIRAVNPTLYSVRAGNWTDPATWSGGRVPTSLDAVTLNHVVTVTAPAASALAKSGITDNSALAKSITYTIGRLTFNANGSLKMDAQPVMTTVNYSNVSATSADVKGIIRDYRVGNVFKYGICYSTTATTPTTDNSRAEPELISPSYQVPDSETFAMGLTGLRPATIYYARAYARTFTGIIVYGEVVSFTTVSTAGYISFKLNGTQRASPGNLPLNNNLRLSSDYPTLAYRGFLLSYTELCGSIGVPLSTWIGIGSYNLSANSNTDGIALYSLSPWCEGHKSNSGTFTVTFLDQTWTEGTFAFNAGTGTQPIIVTEGKFRLRSN